MVLCDPGGIRTPNRQSRNLIFYPVELRSQKHKDIIVSAHTIRFFLFCSLRSCYFAKMKYKLIILFALSSLSVLGQTVGIGSWKSHLPFKEALAITEMEGLIYVATKHGLYTFNPNNKTILRLTKVNGLSDIGLSAMGKNPIKNQLLVVYENGNLDLIEGQNIYNIPDLKLETITGEKRINNVVFKNDLAYLSTSFGILELNCTKKEILNTFLLNSQGNLAVFNLAEAQDSLFAVTDSGIFAGYIEDNLSDFHNWTKKTPPQNKDVTAIASFDNNYAVCTDDDSIFYFDVEWKYIGAVEGFRGFKSQNNKLYAFVNNFVYQLTKNGISEIEYSARASYINDVLLQNDTVWIADSASSLIHLSESNRWHLIPEGPNTELVFSLSINDDRVFVSPGGITTTWNNNNIWEGFYWNDNIEWSRATSSSLNHTKDITKIISNPNNPKEIYLGSWNRGILKLSWNDSNYDLETIYDFTNTNGALEPISNDPTSGAYGWLRIKGMAFDNNNNLWIANSQAENALVVKTPDDNWISFNVSSYNTRETHLGSLVIDNLNQKWIVIPKGGGLLVYNDNESVEDSSDDEDITLGTSLGNGALPSKDIYALAKDRDGEIWVGTNKGIAVFYSPENVFSGNDFDAQQILVEVDGYVEHLLANETVTAIAVDGANRKWLGTQSAGVFLVSPDGTEQIHHFTEENSPLFSNTITDIAINHNTGEVYIGTSKGLLSYMSDATQGLSTHQNVTVYPNPVRPEYNGTIAVKGLVEDADVKITDLNGTLVHETAALGGQAVWDGKNGYGERVQTGVYLVFSSNKFGTETNVAKILFIH